MSRAPDLERKRRWLKGPNYDYLKLKKEEVIYVTNTALGPKGRRFKVCLLREF
jgi:hypothetical protein